MLTLLILFAFVLSLVAIVVLKGRRAQTNRELDAVVLFETRIDPPYFRPLFTSSSERDFRLDAPVVHAKLASGVLHLKLQSDAGGEAVGFEVAITNVDLDWLRGETYRNFSPDSQLLIGPLPYLTQRLLHRCAEAHDLPYEGIAMRHVQAYSISAVICDPAEDCLRIEVQLPDGHMLRLAYDYAAASVRAALPTAALVDPANVQPLAIRVAA